MAETKFIGYCKSCLYWTDGDRLGSCHRFPTLTNTSPQHWCGEFDEDIPAISVIPIVPEEFPNIQQKKRRGRPKKHEAEADGE